MQIRIKTGLALFLILALAACSGMAFADSRNLDAARTAFNHGRANDALQTLDAALHANATDAAAWNLQCRIFLAQGRADDAISSCQRAVQIAPSSSDYHVWLGRAYGEKAQHSRLMVAYKTAKLVHSEFEAAVSLDGKNRDALSDLGQYYIEAPLMLGGSYAKAQDLAQRLDAIEPARAEELRAFIAEAKQDYPTAERAWRARISASQSSSAAAAQAWMDLGSYYRRQSLWNEMLAALKSGAAADTNHGPALVDGATTLIQAHRASKLAEQWLREYLSGNALSDTAPAFAVHVELGDLLKNQGDVQAAERQFAEARALSTTYTEPATISTGD